MIVWLASFPRSGNTLLRILLFRAFGLESHSLYDDPADIGRSDELRRLVGHAPLGSDRESFLTEAAGSPAMRLVKTHELVSDRNKAILVVRDGRAAIVSYYHYVREIAGEQVTLSDVIRGKVWGADWSTHAASWLGPGAGDTLLLRFEELVGDPDGCMTKAAGFLGLPPPRPARVDFAELRRVDNRFFRSGSDAANLAELKGEDLGEFEARHGEMMRRLGYG
jgi:hypothetical protein